MKCRLGKFVARCVLTKPWEPPTCVEGGGWSVMGGEGVGFGGEEGLEETYVDDGGGPERGPGVVVGEMLEIVASALNERTHRTPEAFGALRILREDLEDRLVRIVRQRESLHPHFSTTIVPLHESGKGAGGVNIPSDSGSATQDT